MFLGIEGSVANYNNRFGADVEIVGELLEVASCGWLEC